MALSSKPFKYALSRHYCRGDWGPHLVVVPTSVMLNWEMEFKKWCPAFKLLTYYGGAPPRPAPLRLRLRSCLPARTPACLPLRAPACPPARLPISAGASATPCRPCGATRHPATAIAVALCSIVRVPPAQNSSS